MNDFFSRFETVQYSLNLADDSYMEPNAGMKTDERELMYSRRLELNDKLKSVILIRALGIDENHRRDVLAKVDFNKEPKVVYETTKRYLWFSEFS